MRYGTLDFLLSGIIYEIVVGQLPKAGSYCYSEL
jgi:hypothetical protein